MRDFCYTDERFADLQMLRYQLTGFEQLSIQQKRLIYYLSKAALFGRDITFDQYGRYNLRIRKTLETVYTDLSINHEIEHETGYLNVALFGLDRALAVYCIRWMPADCLWTVVRLLTDSATSCSQSSSTPPCCLSG